MCSSRFLSIILFPISVVLALSLPSFALYYNLGMFWKGAAGAAGPVFTERKITIGNHYSCALISDGTVKCWGINTTGMLGDGTTTNRSEAVTVSGLSGVIAITGGGYQTCAVLSDGTVNCW